MVNFQLQLDSLAITTLINGDCIMARQRSEQTIVTLDTKERHALRMTKSQLANSFHKSNYCEQSFSFPDFCRSPGINK